jgi:hypothetical protein
MFSEDAFGGSRPVAALRFGEMRARKMSFYVPGVPQPKLGLKRCPGLRDGLVPFHPVQLFGANSQQEPQLRSR